MSIDCKILLNHPDNTWLNIYPFLLQDTLNYVMITVKTQDSIGKGFNLVYNVYTRKGKEPLQISISIFHTQSLNSSNLHKETPTYTPDVHTYRSVPRHTHRHMPHGTHRQIYVEWHIPQLWLRYPYLHGISNTHPECGNRNTRST